MFHSHTTAVLSQIHASITIIYQQTISLQILRTTIFKKQRKAPFEQTTA